ncbi:MAG: DMT family transporter [Saprospiraceae bacterium]|nr:DMT family transporter [Saprospiraceae bacterium]
MRVFNQRNKSELKIRVTARQRFLLGILLLVVANICFSAKAVLVKLLYREGLDVPSVIALRMLLSFPFYAGMAVFLHQRSANVRLSGREVLAVSALGILSYYVSSMLDFMGLQYVTASVERLVLFTYPTMVLLLSSLFFHKKISSTQVLALVLTYTGVVLAFAAELKLGAQRNIWLGGMFVFGCAATYSIYIVFTGELVHKIGSAKFTCYAVMAATVPALLQSALHNRLDVFQYTWPVYHLSIWLAVVATVVPTFLIVEGIRLVGANNSSVIGFVGPVATIFLGYWFLGEPVTSLQLLGTSVVLAGVFLLSWKGKT